MEFVSVIDGQKTINFELLEEQHGAEFAKAIQKEQDFCVAEQLDWKIEEIYSNEHFITFAFSTYAYSHIYELSLERKTIVDKNRIGFFDAERLLVVMNSLRPR